MVDPKNVLEAISPMLDSNGGIKELSHVGRIVGFMRDNATKMASRCVYLLIISSTKNKDILRKFVSSEGWLILSNWLDDSVKDDNMALIVELLGVFSKLPVDFEVLKTTNSPKVIAKLSKNSDKKYAEVVRLSKRIVTSWKSAVRSIIPPKPASDQQSVKKDDDSSNSIIDDLQDAVDTISKPMIPPSTSLAVTGKPKLSTVKTHPIKFRSTGLEGPAKRTNSLSEDPSTQKRAKLGSGNVFESLNSHVNGTTVPQVAKKPVQAPQKIVEYRESSGFMDAISSVPARSIPPPATLNATTSPTSLAPGLRRKKKVPAPISTTERTVTPPMEIDSPLTTSPNAPESAGISKQTKKKVWWPEDHQLCKVKEFVVEYEPIMHGRQHGDAMKKAEMQLDRSALQMRKRADDVMKQGLEDADSGSSSRSTVQGGSSPSNSWKRPVPIDLPDNIANIQRCLGKDSKEKFVQTEHQLRVLEVVYFIRRDIPDSPAEPNSSDLLPEDSAVTKQIPLEVVPDAVENVAPVNSSSVFLPGPLTSVIAAISQPTPTAVTPPQQPAEPSSALPAGIPPPPPGMTLPGIPPFPADIGPVPPPFPMDPNMPFPPMPPNPDGSMPMPPFPPPPGFPFPFPPPPGISFPPVPSNGDSTVNAIQPSIVPPFPPSSSAPSSQPSQPSSLSPPTIVPVGSSGPGLLPTPVDGQSPQAQNHHSRDYGGNKNSNFNNNTDGRRPPVSIRFPAGIPSKVPFGVCRYFYESGTCPRQHYCKFKHIQRQVENSGVAAVLGDHKSGGNSPHTLPPTNHVRAQLAAPVAVGRR